MTKTATLSKIAVNFDFTISVNYGYLYDFENVKIIKGI